jgi:hypothetical protein
VRGGGGEEREGSERERSESESESERHERASERCNGLNLFETILNLSASIRTKPLDYYLNLDATD